MANTAASLWQSHVFPVRHTETDAMAMGGGTTTVRTPPAATAATATSRGSTSSSTSSSGGDDTVVVRSLASSSARPHARSVPDAKSARVPSHHHYQQRDHYLHRMGSRSLNEDYSTTSSLSEESEDTNCSVDGGRLRNSLPERSAASSASDASLTVRHGTDPHLDDRYYAMLRDSGNFVKMGWLTKQGHVWKNWKSRFFVLFRDGTLAYYKAKNKRRMKGCIKLNDGVVSIQHLDIRKSQKPYVFQVEKGFYRMWCCCCSQLEAELWVNALRDVRQSGPPCFEPLLTVPEEQLGCAAVNRQLNKIFVTDRRIMSMLQAHKNSIVPHTVDGVYTMIGRLEDAILDRYQGYLYMDPEVELLSGNELVKLLRRHVEDRAFIPVASFIYAGLENNKIRAARTRIARNTKLLKNKSQRDLGVPSEIADISGDWTHAIVIVDALDCATLISHKIDLIINAANSIDARVAQYHGALAEISDETLTAIFRYVLVKSSLDDIAVLHALLKPVYLHHPACQNKTSVLAAFIDAICWLDSYKVANDDDPGANLANGVSLASSRVDVSISTADVGILFTTDGNGRGAIVHTVRKLSQAALSEKIVPGLSLIAINDEPVILMPFREICQRLRTAALPKRLTFLPEFFYYQLLSLDSDMYQYLLCLAAGRGDKDSVSWLMGSQLDVSELSTWEQTRGPQVLGFTPPSSRGSALHAAVHNCHYAMVDYLLRLGAKPNLEDRHGRTPLHMLPASGFDIVPVIQELQSSGANLDAKDGEGVTPLMAMARRGSMEGVTTLLALRAKLDAIAWSTGYSALEYAVVYGAIDVAELLLSKGADPNRATLDGDTSLHLASTAGDAEILQVLVNAGGDVNKQNRFGQTPAACLLSQSSRRLQDPAKDCLTILLQAGDAQKPDLLGRHLLHLAQLSNDDSVRQLMQELCSRRDSRIDSSADIFGCTARDYDAGAGNDQVHWRMRHPRELLSWSSKDLTGKARRQSSLAKSKSFDELMETLLHDVSVDLADLVAFVMFLDSFSSLGAVVNYLREFILNGSQARNVLRFILVLLLFKFRHARDGDSIVGEIQSLLEQHRRRMQDKTVILLDDYRTMFAQYFTLQGSAECLEHYSSLPIAMQHRYGGDQPSKFSTVFPRNIFIQVEPSQWAEHCTLLTHTLFCSIPVTDFVSVGSKAPHSPQFVSAKRWFQHLTAYVVNAVLIEDSREGRVEVIDFFLAAAESCLTLRNYDTLAAILYALQSTAVQRLRRTLDGLSVASKKLLSKMQSLSDKGCRDVNKIMHAAENPSMPYIGLYLQGFVGLNELPVFEKADLINGGRLRKMGELAVEILHRRSVAYHLSFFEDVDSLLHVQLPFPTDESRYSRSLQLEPREAGAAPLGDRATYVAADDLDLDNEVRESIGAEGTFGIRQWFRMQKVVHRNRSRSATQAAVYEWV